MQNKSFKGQDLRGRSFKGQDLTAADFSGCDLRGVDFSFANLTAAKFCRAKMGRTFTGNLNFLLVQLLLNTFSGFVIAIASTAIYDFSKTVVHIPFPTDIFPGLCIFSVCIATVITINHKPKNYVNYFFSLISLTASLSVIGYTAFIAMVLMIWAAPHDKIIEWIFGFIGIILPVIGVGIIVLLGILIVAVIVAIALECTSKVIILSAFIIVN